MKLSFSDIFKQYLHPYVTEGELETLLGGTPASRYGKVKRWLAQGRLLRIRRGLYCLTERMGSVSTPHPFALAQRIYGPSYVSFESALNFHRLIPEAVYTTTSASTKRSKEFQTPFGVFSYQRLPLENFYILVDLIRENENQFLMAKPWKAICDYIFCYKKDWDNLKPLQDSLRINLEELPELRLEEVELLDEYYHHARMSRFLKSIKKFK